MAVTPRLARAIVGAALSLGAAPIFAQEVQRAAAPSSLRALTTDRPDTTESPFTINAGHVQIETTLFGYTRSARDAAGVQNDRFEIATTNLRIGLSEAIEFDFVLHPYGGSLASARGPARGGIGAVDLRAKVNFWGNDGGKTALALLPFLSVATDSDNGFGPVDVEYGVLVPLSIEISDRLGLGLNAGLNLRRSEETAPYRISVPLTASLAVAWADRIGGFYEVAAEVGGGESPSLSLNTGITWLIADDLQLDTGIGIGVAGSADQIAPFLGFSARF